MTTTAFTIGEVLNQLKHDFEDISISKIRFLESEGLISPDRTDSGYRKFSGDDVDRLRFILTAQRDHYLPLKVIREQLERVDSGNVDEPDPEGANGVLPGMGAPSALEVWKVAEAAHAEAARQTPEPGLLDPTAASVALSLTEFCEASGLRAHDVRELKEYGIVSGRGNDAAVMDGDDLAAARAARELLRMGLEARHLRMYAQFVDRELALFAQLVMPLMRQRGPEARRRAAKQLESLAGTTQKMKRALLARALRAHVQGG